jgi:hypothetical protein
MEAHRRKVYQTKEYLLSLGYVDYEKCIKYVQNILFIFLVDFPLMGSKCSPVLFAPSIFNHYLQNQGLNSALCRAIFELQ